MLESILLHMGSERSTVHTVNKETLVDRLQKLSAVGRTMNAPVEIFFDETVWAKGHRKFEIFDGIYEYQAPDEVYDKLREFDRKPHSYFGIRDGLISKVESYQGNTLTPHDLQRLFEEGDALTLGEFRPLGTSDDFFSTMNDRYYGALGQRAFTWEGQVPIKLPNEPLIQRANAINLYQRIVNGDFGEEGKVVVQKWGSGGLLDSITDFLAQIQELDEKNGTQVYQRMDYVVSDISEKSIRDSRQKAGENEKAKAHVDNGVLRFEVFDANTTPATSDVANIESSYLYDSISQPIIAKVDGEFYELHFRGYVDARRGNEFEMNDYSRVNPAEFKQWFESRDLEKLSQVRPRTFQHIDWEVKLVKIDDISKYPNGNVLKEMTTGVDNVTLPTAQTSIESIGSAVSALRSQGYVQVFDVGMTDSKGVRLDSGELHRYNGSVYTMVNFPVIRQVLQAEGSEVKVEHLTDYLEGVLGERVIPSLTLPYCARDTETFDKYFPFELMRKSKWIQKTADRIKRQEGYSDRGRGEFYWALHEAGLTDWCRNTWLDRDRDNEDYVADFRETIRLAIHYRAFEGGPSWIFEKSPNEAIVRKVEALGFERKLIDHLFEHHKEVAGKLEYQHLCVQKGS